LVREDHSVDGRFRFEITDVRSCPLGLEIKTTVFNDSDQAVSFIVVDAEDRELSEYVRCGPGEQAVLVASNLTSISCFLKYCFI
jgi:hypothetical protein